MNVIIKQLLNATTKIQPTIHPEIALNAIHYSLGIIASSKRAMLVLEDEHKPISYFGLTLAPSGSGKDLSVAIAFKAIAKAIDLYNDDLAAHMRKYFSGLEQKDIFDTPSLEFERATVEGFLQTRVNIQNLGFGVANLRIPEIQDMLKNKESQDIFSEVVKAWETGDTGGKTNRGKSIAETKGIPVNVMVYGSPNAIRTNKHLNDQLLSMLTSGLGRRVFLAAPKAYEVEELVLKDDKPTAESMVLQKEVSAEGRKDLNNIADHLCEVYGSDIKDITLSPEAELLFQQYTYDSKIEYVGNVDVQDGLVAERAGRAWKAVRLAALYAYINGTDQITDGDMEDAIEFADHCGIAVEEVFYSSSNEEMLLRYLAEKKIPCTRQEIIQNALDGCPIRVFEDAMILAEELADSRNQIIEGEGKKIIRYQLKQLYTIDEDEVQMSFSDKMTEGYQTKIGKFSELHKLLTSSMMYSAGSFKDGYRTRDNYTGKQDVIILDFDEGLTISMAKEMFADYKCVIATTKSHQKEKNDVICDRFRVIILPEIRVEFNSEMYADFMRNVMDLMGLPADRKCVDSSRFYYGYPGAEVWYSDGDKRLDIKPFIPNTTRMEETAKRVGTFKNTVGIESYFLATIAKGNRSDGLFRYAMVLCEEGYLIDDIESKVKELNAATLEPLRDTEIDNTILKSAVKKLRLLHG